MLDFLKIIYVGGLIICGASFSFKWVTIMIVVNLQAYLLTPPFRFALFYLRGVPPPSFTTQHIYRGIIPFVGIQVVGLAILWLFPGFVTIVPEMIP